MDRSRLILWFALALLVACSTLAGASAVSQDLNPLLGSSHHQDQQGTKDERADLDLAHRGPKSAFPMVAGGLNAGVKSGSTLAAQNLPFPDLYVGPVPNDCNSPTLKIANHPFSSSMFTGIDFVTSTTTFAEIACLRRRAKTSGRAQTEVKVQAEATWTNATFESTLCGKLPQVDSYYLHLHGLPGLYFVIPSCLSTYPNSFQEVYGSYLIIEDFSLFPTGIGYLVNLEHCITTPASLPTTAYGFEPDGTIKWSEVLTIFGGTLFLQMNDCRLRGSLPDAYPSRPVCFFELSNNQLTGTITPTFFTNWNSIDDTMRFNANGNRLTGTLPPALFQPIRDNPRTGKYIGIDLSDNLLSGSIPSQWLPASANWHVLGLSLSRNQLTGSIPDDLLPANLVSFGVSIYLESNQLTGSFPPALFHTCFSSTSWAQMNIWASHNRLSGTLPSSLVLSWPSAKADGITLFLDNNTITGSIPPNMLTPDRNCSFTVLYINLAQNRLTGPLPERLFSTRDSMTGEVIAANITERALLIFEDNQIEGTIPPSLLTDFVGPFNANIRFSVIKNRLNGTIPPLSIGGSGLEYLLSLNPNLVGSIPPSLLTYPLLSRFEANGTGLTGDIPPMLSGLGTLDLSNTQVSFCSDPSKTAMTAFQGTCAVYGTSACGCSASYGRCERCCTGSGPPNFKCSNGVWVPSGASSDPVLVIPRSSTPVILGNLTASEVTVSGINTTIIVQGSIFNLTTLSIVLDNDDLKSLGSGTVSLLKFEGGDTNTSTAALQGVRVQARVQNSCKTVKATSFAEDRTLYGVFAVNRGTCDRWWIITVSVVGSLLVILAVVGVIVLLTRKPSHHKPNKSALG